MSHVVYWIRDSKHCDPKTEGYIGVSRDLTIRLQNHWFHASTEPVYHVHRAMKRHRDSIVVSVLSSGDEEYCYCLENLLRPSRNIGWNSAIGGDVATATRGRECSEITRQKIRMKAIGRVKPDSARKRQSEAMTGRNLWSNSAANREIWSKAILFYDWNSRPENCRRSAKSMVKDFGITGTNPWKLLDKLRSGWNPSTDTDYLSWLEIYKESNVA